MRFLALLFFGFGFACAHAQTQTQEEKKLEAFFPSAFGEYQMDGIPMTVTSRSEGKSYVMSSRNYRKGEQTFSAMVIDCKNTPTLLKKYKDSWLAPETDDENQTIKRTTTEGHPSWQVHDKKKKSSQLSIAVSERFMIIFSGESVSPELFNSAAKSLKFADLPKN